MVMEGILLIYRFWFFGGIIYFNLGDYILKEYKGKNFSYFFLCEFVYNRRMFIDFILIDSFFYSIVIKICLSIESMLIWMIYKKWRWMKSIIIKLFNFVNFFLNNLKILLFFILKEFY